MSGNRPRLRVTAGNVRMRSTPLVRTAYQSQPATAESVVRWWTRLPRVVRLMGAWGEMGTARGGRNVHLWLFSDFRCVGVAVVVEFLWAAGNGGHHGCGRSCNGRAGVRSGAVGDGETEGVPGMRARLVRVELTWLRHLEGAGRWCADAGRPPRFKPSSPSPTDAVRDGSAKLGHPVQNVTREHGLTPLPR